MTLSKATFETTTPVSVLGVMDAQSTQSVEAAGYVASYFNGYDVVRSQLGKTNEGLISPSELSASLRHVKEESDFPVIVDAESGFGNQLTTYFVTQDLERSGAAGLVINDQIFPAHTAAAETQLIEFSDFVAKLKAAKDAFDDPETLLFAELDGVSAYGQTGLAKRVEYLKVNELADVILIGHVSEADFEGVAALAQQQAIGLVINTVRDAYFDASQATAFKTIFYTGALSQARQQAEQQVARQLEQTKEATK